MMVEKILAGIVLALCAVLLLRMGLPEAQRRRVDAVWRRAAHACRRAALRVWYWREHRQRAAREAEQAIRRAQHRAERDGNVIRPDAFKGPRKPH